MNSPSQFLCWCTAPFDVCLVLDLKSGGIALTLLGAGLSPQIQKNLPNARGAVHIPVWIWIRRLVVGVATVRSGCFPSLIQLLAFWSFLWSSLLW